MVSRIIIIVASVSLSCAAEDRSSTEQASPLALHVRKALVEEVRPVKREALTSQSSLEYLRTHSTEALDYVEPGLMTESTPGKWATTRLVGQFGRAKAIDMLRKMALLELPTQHSQKRRGGPGVDEIHEAPHSPEEEELLTRLQAVASIGDIATRESDLEQPAIDSLVEIAQLQPGLRGMALHKLRAFMNAEDYMALKPLFSEKDAYYFKESPSFEEVRALLADAQRAAETEGD